MLTTRTSALLSLILLLDIVLGSHSFGLGHSGTMRRSNWGSKTCSRLHCQRTLASDYVINVGESSWSAYPIDSVVTMVAAEGEKAVASLQAESWDITDLAFTLSASVKGGVVKVTLESDIIEVDPGLVAILARIMAQGQVENSSISSIQLPNEESIDVNTMLTEEGILKLFQPLIGSIENIELSEMVNQKGESLGMVPRKLVHKANLLHRGIGMVVTKDKPILTPQCTNFPELYMHRRTATKRIFPSLYDMFVGGVSTAKEDSKVTAQREVAEELGLERALTDPNMISDPLFECTVCTAYNRCVVTMFCCTFQSKKDSISWQEEEVAWGNFVPHDAIAASADLSIQRLIDKSDWPGSIPIRMKERLAGSEAYEGENDAWKDWDYVPDGLLVWEAWIQWQTEMVKESKPHVEATRSR